MMQQKGLVWLPALSSVSFAVLAGTKSSKNLPVTEVSSSHNECKHKANLLSKKMPSYAVTLETRNLNRQKEDTRNCWLQAWSKIRGGTESLNDSGSI